MNEKNLQEEKSSILTLILSSILLHLLVMLAIIFYRFEFEKSYEIPRITPDDQAVLWTNPPTNIAQQVSPPQPKIQPEPKKEEPKIPPPNMKSPKIMPGKQGLDQQDFNGDNALIQEKKSTEKKKEEKPKTQELKKEDPKPKGDTQHKIASDAGKKLLQPTTDIIRQDPTSEKKSLPIKDITPCEPAINASQPIDKKKDIVFDTNLDFLGRKTLQEKLIEKDEKYENVPTPQTNKMKSISYKDIGLGFSSTNVSVGNSAHMMMQGTSPDIPQGDELKYITYLNQMANMIVASMRSNSQLHLLPQTRGETIVCFMKVTKEGQLLDVRILKPSKHEIINIFIIESIKRVGLFNQLPKFINKETFEISWHILT
jgi:hypothetical protein